MNRKNQPILLVEDNPMDADLTQRSFARRNLGHPIELARDGEEALAFIQRWESGESLPMVILLDFNLPKVNGMEVLQEFESYPAYRTIPVILLLSSEQDREILKSLSGDNHPYIVKPVNFDKFVQVAECMGLSLGGGGWPND